MEAVAGAVAVGQAVAGVIPTHRQCSVEIENGCTIYTLCNPRSHMKSGSCSSPLPPTIPAYASGSALFIKTPHAACGTVGVFTCDIQHNQTKIIRDKLAVMFSVPYDFNLYSNWYSVGIFDKSKQCDYDLYCEMYYKQNCSFKRSPANGSVLTFKGKQFTIMATMSNTYQPVIKMQIGQNHD